ncbi:MAG: alpha-glucan family phosphorylase [Thermodesulfobacteriota bacterium]
MKAKIKYKVVPNIPKEIETLRRLAYNLCFSWKDEIQYLFQRIDPRLWEQCGHNPVLLLGMVSQERLNELSRDHNFLAQLEQVSQNFDRYMSQPRILAEEYYSKMPFQAAYFSAEFGLSECLPIYSGGMGVLAGDTLKSASDLNVPLVGIGLLYQEGYFSQYLSSDGWQMESYPMNDFHTMPVTLVRDIKERPLTVSVDFKREPVQILIWRIDVGRVPIYLLDTNTGSNPPEFRRTTAQLYGGDRENRLRQEIVLGIGGVRALKALGIEPTVIHINEGHSAFSALERINILRKEEGLSFDAAREVVLATTVFTTHTPVPAGNDLFDPGLLRMYFEEYAKELGINFKVLLGYGRLDPQNDSEAFGMSTLGVRLSAYTNAVSRLHRQISQALWQRVWHHHPVEDVPIDYVTNGIHVPTWISRGMAELYDRYLGPDWAEDPDNEKVWEQAEWIPDPELWRTRERCRENLVGFVRIRLQDQLNKQGAPASEIQSASEVLTPEALTIGFARRFATYKRATLFFRDPDRLDRIVNNAKYPVQIVLAGKAHPQDNEGKEYIKQIYHLAREERFRRRIVFLEDYNMHVAQKLVSGCDLWLNTPRRPLEACGTSGMKALANGSLNFSVLDGWWDEGYHRDFGWSIGHGEVYQDHAAQDRIESRDLYNLLEEEIIPLFYQRGPDGIPRGWVDKMRSGLRRLVPVFNSHRMVQEYVNRYYLPCSMRSHTLSGDGFHGAKDLAVWRQKIMTSWHEIAIQEVSSPESLDITAGQELEVAAKIELGSLSPEDVTVEAYYGSLDHEGDFSDREMIPLHAEGLADGLYTFRGQIPCRKTGRFGYTVRITPSKDRLENRFAMGLVAWA